MYVAQVEILSDATNMPVIRHPAREFPGVLVQGDTLHSLCTQAADALLGGPDSRDELEDLHNRLLELLAHYKTVLSDHQLSLPFADGTDA